MPARLEDLGRKADNDNNERLQKVLERVSPPCARALRVARRLLRANSGVRPTRRCSTT